jgi:DNA-binding CsgD family transcriptional regulator
VDFKDNRLHAARVHHVLGLINLVENNELAAYGHLAELFSYAGAPLHRHASVRALADYAQAAVLADMDDEARRRLPAISAHLPRQHSARVSQLVNHASALLGLGNVDDTFASMLDDPAGEQWPFERARLRLSYAGWLRRNRRRKEAQHQLSSALALFEKLGAKPWLDVCTRELRASGVRAAPAATPTTAQLSPQEHQVVYLVSEGLTNPQIAARLHLSPRTVSGYLYRSFPKLGVTSRHQIRDVPPPPDWQSTAG